jgi:hypothetical protein
MRALLAASAAVSALTLSAPAWAQPYPPQGYPPQSYPGQDQAYPDDADGGDYGQYGQPGPEQQDMGPYDDNDMSGAYGPDNGYGGDQSAPSEQYGSAPDSMDRGAPQYAPYENAPPAPRPRYASAPPQSVTPALPQYSGVPREVLGREARLERRIQRGGERGVVPAFHVDNLMVQLDSIRAQQDELAERDGGLNPTDRAFIESRLARLEANVTW